MWLSTFIYTSAQTSWTLFWILFLLGILCFLDDVQKWGLSHLWSLMFPWQFLLEGYGSIPNWVILFYNVTSSSLFNYRNLIFSSVKYWFYLRGISHQVQDQGKNMQKLKFCSWVFSTVLQANVQQYGSADLTKLSKSYHLVSFNQSSEEQWIRRISIKDLFKWILNTNLSSPE